MRKSASAGAAASSWWRFVDADATGAFRATGAGRIGRLYLPLVNDAGALSWTSPHLHGGLAAGHHAYLTPPLTVEEFPHTLLRRDFWVVEDGREPFAASGISPRNLGRPGRAVVDAGPGWCAVSRQQPGRVAVTVTLWCPADLPAAVELMRVEVRNLSRRRLAFDSYAMIPLFARSADNVRDHRHVTALLHRIHTSQDGVTVHPTMSFDERGHAINRLRYSVVAAGPGGQLPAAVWGREQEFVGEGATLAAPEAVWQHQRRPPPGRRHPAAGEAVAGFRFAPRTLGPGRRAVYTLACAISGDPQAATRVGRWIRRPSTVDASLRRTQARWQQAARQVSFATGDRMLDHWLAWVGLQPTFRRLYGNSYLPQFDYGRGGRGWRDLWQDCLALLLTDPSRVRAMLLHNIGGIRIDGSNATIIGSHGEFIADRNNIPRTWMDHGAWPLHTIFFYLDQTGDLDVLLQRRAYFRDPQLFRCRTRDWRWTEREGFKLRTRAGRIYRGTVLEHLLVQHLTAFFNVGGHNCCRLEGADWNDGLDMAAARGESVAFTAFYAWNLSRLADMADTLAARGVASLDLAAELCVLLDRLPGGSRVNYASAPAKQRRLAAYLRAVARRISGRTARVRAADLAADLRAKHADLAHRIRTQEWLRARGGGWFNGYYDDAGRRVEGAFRRGVRMTLTGQVFPLMSGIASETQVDAAIRAVNRWLKDPASGGVRLNTDFGSLQPRLGRAFSFAYGEKENGAVFSHMAVMYAYALYARRRPREGRAVWSTLYRMAVNQPVARIFPCLPEYFNAEGRGLYGYLTGSASWLIHLLLTQAYGIRGDRGDLVIDPQLTREDFGRRYSLGVGLQFAGRPLSITIDNPRRLAPGASRVAVVRRGGSLVASTAYGKSGVRITRRVVAGWPKRGVTELRVMLG